MAEGDTLHKPTLSRPVKLGMLYDCRSDTLIPGLTLWDRDILRNNYEVNPHTGTEFKIILSDEMSDNANARNIDESLEVSVPCGLLDEVQGSAKYLTDTSSSESQFRLTLHYKTTTKFEQLTMQKLGRRGVQNPDVFDQGTATHVVTGILYGAQAFCVLDSSCRHKHEVTGVQGRLHSTLMKLFIEGAGGGSLETEERGILETMNCTFHGDFRLEKNPSNYKEAIKVFQELPSMLGSDGEKAVPMRMWLYPLHKLDDKSARIVRQIDAKLITKSQGIIQGIDNLRVKCNDMIRHDVCLKFPQFPEKLNKLQQMLIDYTTSLQQTFKADQKISGGENQENLLAYAIRDSEQSPFSLKSLGDYIENKEREINVVQSVMANFPDNIPVIRSDKDFENQTMDSSAETLLCFSFPLAQREAYLDALSEYMKSRVPNANRTHKIWFDKTSTTKNRLLAKYFTDLYQASTKASTGCHFAVTGIGFESEQNVEEPVILVFKKGDVITRISEPPAKPTKPSVTSNSHDQVTLHWQPPARDKAEVNFYQVMITSRAGHQSRWSDWKQLPKSTGLKQDNKLTKSSLQPFTSYKFYVEAVCRDRVSRTSEHSDVCTPCPASPPEQVRKHGVSEKSVTIFWNRPSTLMKGFRINHYKVRYEEIPESNNGDPSTKAVAKTATCPTNVFTIEGVKGNRRYRIWVSAVCDSDGNSAESKPIVAGPDSVHTNADYIKVIAENAEVLEKGCQATGKPKVVKIPLIQESDHSEKWSRYSFGKTSSGRISEHHKVIMVVGATGAGKSTLINGMINYIFGVTWKDGFRFKIIHEQERSQEHSQTQNISSYTIYRHEYQKLSYNLTIIDTPGFGDTRGIKRDQAIAGQIQDFFTNVTAHQIGHIDAIGFVTPASLPRLTSTQSYVFDSILSVFGKDISTNILLLITFCDGQEPLVTSAIKAAKIPHSKTKTLKFNNSALFANTKPASADKDCDTDNEDSQRNFDEMYWKMGSNSMKNFFRALDKLEPKSLVLTSEVLKERERLEIAVQSLQPKIMISLCKQEEIRREYQVLKDHEAQIQANKSFTYEVEGPKNRQIPTDAHSTNCTKCHFTCHYPCTIKDDGKRFCGAMNVLTGNCKQCPGRCNWRDHINQKIRYQYYIGKETRTYADLEERYKEATGKKLSVQQIIKKLEEEFTEAASTVFALIAISHQSIKRLDEIALKPNPLSTVDYVELLIESEKRQVQPGWQSRVKALHDVRDQAEMISGVSQADLERLENDETEMEGLNTNEPSQSLKKLKKGSRALFDKMVKKITIDTKTETGTLEEKNDACTAEGSTI